MIHLVMILQIPIQQNLQVMERQQQLQEIKSISNEIWKQYFKEKKLEQLKCDAKVRVLSIKTNNISKKMFLIEYDKIPSTMIPADQWPRQKLSGQDIYCFIAREQGEGVGQKTNKWISPKGNIYMTMLIKYRLDKLQELVIRVNNSVVKLLQLCGTNLIVKSKWVNDIFINDKKVSGALIRNQLFAADTSYALSQIGVGINIQNAPSIEFTCLAQHTKINESLSQITELLIHTLVQQLFNSSGFSVELKLYQSNLLYLSQKVAIYNSLLTEKTHEGIFVGINQHGHALIDNEGEIIAVSDGRMRPQLKLSNRPLNVKQIMKEL